ncbi:integrin [Hydrogenophaga sp. 2FB]|uniref:integrin n=1 Tax=Hydrogenophaga sp. 2FB TaxID=2502187 RepID=UPI001485425F|nr:integrin [Hydrogenophaga sp. 2FB]
MSSTLFKLRFHSLAGLLLALLLGSCGGSPVPDGEMANVEMAIHYIKASNTDAGDWFGGVTVLSADGNTLAVSAPLEDSDGNELNNALDESGAVYIFVRSGNTWVQQAYLKAPNLGLFDNFGWSVALSADGNVLAVGAPSEDSNDVTTPGDDSFQDSGAVYVFTRSATVWTQRDYLKAGNIGAGDTFGTSIALAADGRTLAVGAPFENGDASSTSTVPNEMALAAGAVYVFARNQADIWTQKAYLKASNAKQDAQFGTSVALSGDGHTLGVGAVYEASADGNQANTSAPAAGAVYTFGHDATGTWTQQAYLKASNIGAGDEFGQSVALSTNGSTLAVGAPKESGPGDAMPLSGAVYVFEHSVGGWNQQALVRADNPHTQYRYGSRVALTGDGNTLAVGAPVDSSNAKGINGTSTNDTVYHSGAAHVLTRQGGTWPQQAYVKASNSRVLSQLGAVALSDDGLTWAFGAPGESSNAKGINGNQADSSAPEAGAVYLMNLKPAGSDGSCTPHTFASCTPPPGWR